MAMVGHVACMGDSRSAYNIFVEKTERKGPLGRPSLSWEAILEWILGKYGGRMWTGFNWLKIKTSAWFL